MFNFNRGRKLIENCFKKKESNFTGFEIRLYRNGVLVSETIGPPDQCLTQNFPWGSFIKVSEDTVLTGYNIVPHLERI